MRKQAVYILSVTLQLLGISGLVDGAVRWQGFFGQIVEIYDTFRGTVFSVLPIPLDPGFQNWLIIGCGVWASVLRLVPAGTAKSLRQDLWRDLSIKYVFLLLAVAALNLVFWPLVLYFFLANPDRLAGDTLEMHRLKTMTVRRAFLKSVGVVVIVFLVCLFVFSEFPVAASIAQKQMVSPV